MRGQRNLPAPKKGASDVATLTTGIAAAVAGIFFPGAALLGPVAAFAVKKYVTRWENVLSEELKKGNIRLLTDEKAAAFVPMAYKFFEQAKEAEYEHNLKLLAEFLKGELELEQPDSSSFARMARRIEGLSREEMKVIALISGFETKVSRASTDAPSQSERPYFSARQLAKDRNNRAGFNHFFLQEALTELYSRGLLIADGASRVGQAETNYFASSSFMELLDKARESIQEAGR